MAKEVKKKAAKKKTTPKVEERIYLDMSFEQAMKLAATTPKPKHALQEKEK
jgi:hypothetical protein